MEKESGDSGGSGSERDWSDAGFPTAGGISDYFDHGHGVGVGGSTSSSPSTSSNSGSGNSDNSKK